MKVNKPDKKEIFELMVAGCLLGILCFAVVYGFKIVNVTYNGWLFHGDMDLRQHYVGFCHFRKNPWHFPIGIVDTLSVPYAMSVVYTDSIPLFAIIFKIFRNILPETFQYFGLFGLICFMLMGALAPILIRRFSNSKIVCIAGSLFFILSFPILHRLFYHTALSAQWIIVLALIVWFYTDITDKNQLKKICIYWALIGLISVSIHSYFVFMTGIVLLAQITDGYVKLCINEKAGIKDIVRVILKNAWILLSLVSMGVASFALLYVLGGFYGSGSVSGDGFGSFYANLSSYVNPLHFSRIFGGFENNGMFEFEGFSYLGAGIFLILLSAAVTNIVSLIKKNKVNSLTTSNVVINEKSDDNNLDTDSFEPISKNTVYVIWIFVILVLLFSCFPSYSFGSIKLIKLPLPGFLKRILGICRTNARFVWVGMYLIFIIAMSFIGKNFSKLWVKILFVVAIVIQLFEMSGTIKEYKAKYSVEKEFDTVWFDLEPEGVIDGKSEFFFMYDHNDIMMDTAYYAYTHDMSQNSFYFARTIYDEIDAEIAKWSEEFLRGELRDYAVYVFRNEEYTDEFDKVVKQVNAKKYVLPEHIVIVK
ncbi:MAG: DUF6311 domain-containing protein [Lachnospiraceae bacterium]|nr:DUF6311 domain-containing protein [Lachnospiraceae bacterium]